MLQVAWTAGRVAATSSIVGEGEARVGFAAFCRALFPGASVRPHVRRRRTTRILMDCHVIAGCVRQRHVLNKQCQKQPAHIHRVPHSIQAPLPPALERAMRGSLHGTRAGAYDVLRIVVYDTPRGPHARCATRAIRATTV